MTKSILMCPPQFFDIEYEINPWMDLDNPVRTDQAGLQWRALYNLYTSELGWEVRLIEPVEHLPDMVFTANGGLVINGKVALPRFRQPERKGETALFEQWFRGQGFTEVFQPHHDFEGEGDALLWNDVLFAGYPWRSDRPAHEEIARFFGIQVVGLQLTDARFYHLDTAFTVIDEQTVALYPAAFTDRSLEAVHRLVPQVIEATEGDALGYGLNAVCGGGHVVISNRAPALAEIYRERGLTVHPMPIDEFQKSGGGMKCLSLELSH